MTDVLDVAHLIEITREHLDELCDRLPDAIYYADIGLVRAAVAKLHADIDAIERLLTNDPP